ncbi:hypothetical protein C2G38_2320113 [Gigaspora rosea]|uniref:Uncharacterized protein n=1 Tax=Gigaspora rosea TaxID=44941 RepID=A0A397UYI6_9GLOM|nr:hypothetical protein C2G38_2320113 [Gigaspora rosea]
MGYNSLYFKRLSNFNQRRTLFWDVTLNPYYVWYQCSSGNVTSMMYNIDETSDSSPDTPNFGAKLLTIRNTTSDFKSNGGFVVYGLDQQEQKEFLDYVLEKSISRAWNGTISCNLPVESCKIGPVTPSNKSQIFCVSARNQITQQITNCLSLHQ